MEQRMMAPKKINFNNPEDTLRFPHNQIIQEIKGRHDEFRAVPDEVKQRIIGEIMYRKIFDKLKDDTVCPKITGMLIDFDVLELDEILDMLQDDSSLEERIKEAQEILNEQ